MPPASEFCSLFSCAVTEETWLHPEITLRLIYQPTVSSELPVNFAVCIPKYIANRIMTDKTVIKPWITTDADSSLSGNFGLLTTTCLNPKADSALEVNGGAICQTLTSVHQNFLHSKKSFKMNLKKKPQSKATHMNIPILQHKETEKKLFPICRYVLFMFNHYYGPPSAWKHRFQC